MTTKSNSALTVDIRAIVGVHLADLADPKKVVAAIKQEIDAYRTLKSRPTEPDAKIVNGSLRRISQALGELASLLSDMPDRDSPLAHRVQSAVLQHLGEDAGLRCWNKFWTALDASRPAIGDVSAALSATKGRLPVKRQRLRRTDEKPPKGSLIITDNDHFVAGLLSNIWLGLAEREMPRAQGAPNRGSFAGLVIDLAQVADPTLTEAKILPAIRNAVHDLTRKSG